MKTSVLQSLFRSEASDLKVKKSETLISRILHQFKKPQNQVAPNDRQKTSSVTLIASKATLVSEERKRVHSALPFASNLTLNVKFEEIQIERRRSISLDPITSVKELVPIAIQPPDSESSERSTITESLDSIRKSSIGSNNSISRNGTSLHHSATCSQLSSYSESVSIRQRGKTTDQVKHISLDLLSPLQSLERNRSVSDANVNRPFSDSSVSRPLSSRSRKQPNHQVIETSIYSKDENCQEILYSPTGEAEKSVGKVNQYHILREIGSGAYGKVMLCRNEDSGIYYACKIISKSRLKKKFRWAGVSPDSDEHLQLIKREIAILKKISQHSNINALIEVLENSNEDSLYMIFDLCEYGPVMHIKLHEKVRPFSEELARKYFRDIILGLEFLHYKCIIHRDLKPENLLLNADNIVQISDFGISHMFEDGIDDPIISDKNASPMFTAPEACHSDTKEFKGKAVDIWSLGITLYCLLHGYCPFQDSNIISLCDKILNDPLVISEGISTEAQDLIFKMLQRNPLDRIRLSDIKEHEWLTSKGQDPMISTEQNCVFEDVTAEEVDNAFTPALSVVKIFKQIRRSFKKALQNDDTAENSRKRITFAGITDPAAPFMTRSLTELSSKGKSLSFFEFRKPSMTIIPEHVE